MRDTMLVITARNISSPLVAELCHRLVGEYFDPETSEQELIRLAWQDVRDSLRTAMDQYPLEEAAEEAALGLPTPA